MEGKKLEASVIKMRNIITYLLFAVASIGCSKEYTVGDSECHVKFDLNIPAMTSATSPNGALSSEGVIKSLEIFVIDNDRMWYSTQAYSISGTDGRLHTACTAVLPASATASTLILVANRSNYADRYPPAGSSLSVLKAAMLNDYPTTDIPMCGEAVAPGIAENVTIEVNMLCALACVDVRLDEHVSNFVMNEMYACHVADKFRIVPNAGNIINTYAAPVAIAPTAAGTAAYTVKCGPVAITGAASSGQLFIPESAGTSVPERQPSATCIVVGGIYNSRQTYYRMDFDEAPHRFGQVLRNCRYDFLITKVNSNGWTTPDEAANNEATGLTVALLTRSE
jgi:hypothetical protein